MFWWWLWFPKHVVYQPIFSRLVLNQVNGKYVIALKSKGIYGPVLKSLRDLTHIIKCFGSQIGWRFNGVGLVVEQSSYTNKIVGDCIIYNIDNWLRIILNNFTLKIVFSVKIMI